MKKNFIFACLSILVVFSFVSCQPNEPKTSTNITIINDANQLAKRLVFTKQNKNRQQARVNVAQTPAPQIPSDALKLSEQPTNWNNGVTLTRGKAYYIDSAWEGTISQDWSANEGSIDIYVAADAKFVGAWWNDDTPVNIYILPNAVLTYCEAGYDNMVKIKKATNVYCWGNIDTPENMGFRLYEAGKVHIYNTDGEPFIVRANDAYVTFQVDTQSDFYCEREMIVNGTVQFNGGKSHFANKLTVTENMYVEYAALATFDDCVIVKEALDFKATTGDAILNINKYLQAGSLVTNQGNATMNLKDALFEIVNDGMFVDKGDQRIVVNGIESNYKSIVKVGGKLYFDRGNDYTTIPGDVAAASFPCGIFTGNLNIEGDLRIKFYYDVPDEKAILNEDNFIVPSTVSIADNSWLPASEDGCRPEIGETPVIEVLPPDGSASHKFSATSLTFNGDMLYLCWHANPETNMEYAQHVFSPSVDSQDDFGGIIDVIRIDQYDITSSLFEQSMENDEFKYNHIIYSDGTLYSAATSNKVGAALSKIALTPEGRLPELEQYEEIRVSLTGYSANCVERINNELITISGYSNGGINKFDINDNTNQSKKHINSNIDNFQGKYVYYNENKGKVITLNNTERGIVTIYNTNMEEELSFEVGAIYPTDGKNVCIADDEYIYICKGQNGFEIYDFSGNRIGGSKKSANGVDVDEKYIYLATGDGLAILDRNAIYTDADGNTYNRTIKKFNYRGRGASSVTNETDIKQSANFVKKGPDGRIYVAYGMYGLQIYEF